MNDITEINTNKQDDELKQSKGNIYTKPLKEIPNTIKLHQKFEPNIYNDYKEIDLSVNEECKIQQ